METKAHYVAVGGFVLAAALTLVVVLVWFTGASFSQQYDRYQTDFTGAVTGLSEGTLVRYNGIEVGHVVDLKFDPEDPKVVRVILDVRREVPLHTDAVASMESQGLAGGTYVLIKGGQPNTPLLKRQRGQDYPVIKSVPSNIEQLFSDVPGMISQISLTATRLNRFLDAENLAMFRQILANVKDATQNIAEHNPQIGETLNNLASGTKTLDVALRNIDAAAIRANTAIARIDALAGNLNDVVRNSKPQLAQLTSQGAANLTQLIVEARTMVQAMTRLANSLERNPQRLLTGESRGGYRPQ